MLNQNKNHDAGNQNIGQRSDTLTIISESIDLTNIKIHYHGHKILVVLTNILAVHVINNQIGYFHHFVVGV